MTNPLFVNQVYPPLFAPSRVFGPPGGQRDGELFFHRHDLVFAPKLHRLKSGRNDFLSEKSPRKPHEIPLIFQLVAGDANRGLGCRRIFEICPR